MSPVTGPIEIVMSPEPAHAPDGEGAGDDGAAIPAGAFAAQVPPMRSPSCSSRWP